MPRCTLRCWDPENCGEPCVDRYEAQMEDRDEEMADFFERIYT